MCNISRGKTSRLIVVVGAQWGSEGKEEIASFLSRDSHVYACFSGGPITTDKISLKDEGKVSLVQNSGSGTDISFSKRRRNQTLVPMEFIKQKCSIVIGNGAVVHLQSLVDELTALETSIDPELISRVYISTRAHVLFDFHQEMDVFFANLNENHIGTAGSGTGPTYSTKSIRNGIRFGDLLNSDRLTIVQKVEELVTYFKQYNKNLCVDIEEVVEETLKIFLRIKPCVEDTVVLMNEFLKQGKRIVCSTADSVMNDIDFGTYPHVGATNTTPGGASVGLGIPPSKITRVIGVCKAFTSREAQHWFPSIVSDPVIVDHLLTRGRAGRSRVGWLDLVQLKYASDICGFDSLMLTKLDALSDLEEVGIVSAYEGLDVETDGYPSTMEGFSRIKAKVEFLQGWKQQDLNGIKTRRDLPDQAKEFLRKIETFLGVKIDCIQLDDNKLIIQ